MDRRTALKITACAMGAVGLGILLGFESESGNRTGLPKTSLPPSDSRRSSKGQIDWTYWLPVNSAIIGWVKIPGTSVDYPIVQAPDEDPAYYLSHGVYGETNPCGTPYLDAGNAGEGLESPVCWLFAHNMSDGTMFAPLARYSDSSFAKEHPRITIYRPDGRADCYQVDAVKTVGSSERVKRTDITSSEAARAFYESLLMTADAAYGQLSDGYLGNYALLSTCTDDGGERTVVLTHRVVR